MGPSDSSTTQLLVADPGAGLGRWRDRLRALVYGLYRQRTALSIGTGVEELADLIDEGRAAPGAPPSLTRVTADALSGAILFELCLASARGPRMPQESDLVPMLMYSAVLPYAGATAAAEELGIPPPPR